MTTVIGGVVRWLRILLITAAALALVRLPISLAVADRARSFLATGRGENDFVAAINTRNSLAFADFGVTVAIVVLTMVWMFRLAKNHAAVGRHDATWSSGWGVAGWFTPPAVIFVIPMLMLRELWRATDPEVAAFDPTWKRARSSALPIVWCIVYGAAQLIVAVSAITRFEMNMSVTTLAQARMADEPAWITVIATVLIVASAVCFLAIVHRLSTRHQQLIGEPVPERRQPAEQAER